MPCLDPPDDVRPGEPEVPPAKHWLPRAAAGANQATALVQPNGFPPPAKQLLPICSIERNGSLLTTRRAPGHVHLRYCAPAKRPYFHSSQESLLPCTPPWAQAGAEWLQNPPLQQVPLWRSPLPPSLLPHAANVAIISRHPIRVPSNLLPALLRTGTHVREDGGHRGQARLVCCHVHCGGRCVGCLIHRRKVGELRVGPAWQSCVTHHNGWLRCALPMLQYDCSSGPSSGR
jgi:hypothetical protein